MLSDEFPDHDALSPQTIGGTPVMIHLYVEDVDAFTARAAAAGLKVLRPVADQFYGDRGWQIRGPVRPSMVDRDPQGGYSARGVEQTRRGFVWWRRRLSPAPKSSHLAFWSLWQADNIRRTQKVGTNMALIDTSKLAVVERRPGWRGRYFDLPSMTFGHYEFDAGSSIHCYSHPQEEVW